MMQDAFTGNEIGGVLDRVREALGNIRFREMWGYLLEVAKGLIDVSFLLSPVGSIYY
jgi:hypothetical protein